MSPARPSPHWPATALIDETQSGGEYLLAAVIMSEPRRAALRDEALALRISGRKLHWHNESATRRAYLVHQLAAMPISSVVVVRTARTAEGDERSRRKCLEGLLVELDRRDVDQAVLEAREPSQNRRDLDLVARLRQGRRLRSRLRVDHAAGPAEPLLWLADIVAGAVREHRIDPRRHPEFASSVTIIKL
jgi:hypothetical protein